MTRNQQLISLARTTPRMEGRAGRTLDAIGDQFGLTGKSVDRILRSYSKKTGFHFGFRRDEKAVANNIQAHSRGVCLMCKCATMSPVRYYFDHVCPACLGTGKYRAEIMDKQTRGGAK